VSEINEPQVIKSLASQRVLYTLVCVTSKENPNLSLDMVQSRLDVSITYFINKVINLIKQ